MNQSNILKAIALTASVIALSACGDTSTSKNPSTPPSGPNNGTITVNFKWPPANTQTKAAKALPACTYKDKNDENYSYNYSLGSIILLSSNQVQIISGNNASDSIPLDQLSNLVPSSKTINHMSTNTKVTISERDNSNSNSVNVIPPPQCGTSTGHWTFSPNQVTLTNGGHTTITATFAPKQ